MNLRDTPNVFQNALSKDNVTEYANKQKDILPLSEISCKGIKTNA